MGQLFVQAVMFIDIPVMAAYLMIVSAMFVTINTIVDLIYLWVDPRLRQAGVARGSYAH
jgi:peptide/nickel transport system permease protein